MKILFPIQYYYPSQIGGPANTLYWHIGYLNSKGIETTVITSSVGISDGTNIQFDEWTYTNKSKIRYCKGGRLSFNILYNTIKEIPHNDIIHLSSICYYYTFIWVLIALIYRKSIFLSPRGELFPEAIRGKKKFVKLMTFSCFKIFQRKLVFHATSAEEVICIRNYFPSSKILLRPNFVNLKYRNKPVERTDDLVFLGRINAIKGIDVLIKALANSEMFLNKDARLLIIGKARLQIELQYEEYLRKLVASLDLSHKIVFLGQKEGEEKFSIISKCKALVLPSHSENFGNVVVEALAMSVPVIASKGTPWKDLEMHKMGYWVNNTSDELCSAINHLYCLDVESYDEYCQNAKLYVENYLDINKSKNNDWDRIYKQSII